MRARYVGLIIGAALPLVFLGVVYLLWWAFGPLAIATIPIAILGAAGYNIGKESEP